MPGCWSLCVNLAYGILIMNLVEVEIEDEDEAETFSFLFFSISSFFKMLWSEVK